MCRGRKPKQWTDETIQFIKEYYTDLSNNQIAEVLGISKDRISRLGRKLGLIKKSKCWKQTPKMKEDILKLYPTCSYRSIAEKLHVSENFVYKIILEVVAEDPTFKKRSKEDTNKLIGEYRKKLLKTERSHAAFGLEPKSHLKIFRSDPKSKMRRRLRKRGAYEIDYGGLEVYIINDKRRSRPLELAAESIGFDFFVQVGEADADGLVEYKQIKIRKVDNNKRQ